MRGGGRRNNNNNKNQQNPLDLKRQRQQQQQQESSSDSSSDDIPDYEKNDLLYGSADDDEGNMFGLTEDQMMQMMMGRSGNPMFGRGGAGGGDEGDEFDGLDDFPLPYDDEGDDGFDYDGFDDEEDLDEEDDFDDDDEDDQNNNNSSSRVEVLESSDDDKQQDDKNVKMIQNTDNIMTDNEAPINVNFSVDNMVEEDVPKVASHLEGYFPDPEKSNCDVNALSKLIFTKGLGTSVVLAAQEDGDDDDDDEDEQDDNNDDSDDDDEKKQAPLMDNDEDPEQELYGVLSLASHLPENSIVKPLESILFKEVLSKLSSGTAVHPAALLRGANNCPNALVVSELFSQLPPQLISRLYSVFVEEIEAGCNGKNGALKKPPQYVVFISKVMPANVKSEDKTPLSASAQQAKAYSNEKSSNRPNKKGRREEAAETIVSNDAIEEGDEFVTFMRFEEDLFYRNRDSNGTQVARGRFNGDPSDPRRCLCYALTWKNFKAAVEELSILNQ